MFVASPELKYAKNDPRFLGDLSISGVQREEDLPAKGENHPNFLATET
jgi:hypothetical protein